MNWTLVKEGYIYQVIGFVLNTKGYIYLKERSSDTTKLFKNLLLLAKKQKILKRSHLIKLFL